MTSCINITQRKRGEDLAEKEEATKERLGPKQKTDLRTIDN